jgi:hypothetical protein
MHTMHVNNRPKIRRWDQVGRQNDQALASATPSSQEAVSFYACAICNHTNNMTRPRSSLCAVYRQSFALKTRQLPCMHAHACASTCICAHCQADIQFMYTYCRHNTGTCHLATGRGVAQGESPHKLLGRLCDQGLARRRRSGRVQDAYCSEPRIHRKDHVCLFFCECVRSWKCIRQMKHNAPRRSVIAFVKIRLVSLCVYACACWNRAYRACAAESETHQLADATQGIISMLE